MKFDISEYQNTIYHDPQRYDDQYWWKKNDIEFWKTIYHKNKGNKILELGSGTGRLAIPLIKEGSEYTGLEISQEFCEYTKKRLQGYSTTYNIINQDFRNFNLHMKFDMIFIAFNTFLHLLTNSDASAFLQSVKQHMNKNTLLYIDIFVPNLLFLYRAKKRIKNLEYIDSQTNETIYIDEVCDYNRTNEINKITWIYYSKDKLKELKYNFTMRMYFPNTMNRLIIDSGLQISNLWGDYDLSSFNESSQLQIYECKL